MSEVTQNTQEMKEEIVKNIQMNSKNEIVNALRGKFGTSVNKVFINSIGEEVGFREITVAEQKTLSRIMMDNENRRDIVYDAQCAVINKVCLNEKFDIYEMTEFDKIKLQLALYQSNVAKNDVTFTCEECGTENTYKMDFGKTISKLDDFDLKEKVFKFSDRLADYEFKIEYPSVRRVSVFYKSAMRKHGKVKIDNSTATQINMDYINLFISGIKFTMKENKEVTDINLKLMDPAVVSEIIEEFPQDVIYSDNGVLAYISEHMIASINNAFEEHKCLQCGHVQKNANVSDVQTFF